MRTRPDIQQRATTARINALRQQKIQHVRSQKVQQERAHNTVQYRQNLILKQMIDAFDRWSKNFLGPWR